MTAAVTPMRTARLASAGAAGREVFRVFALPDGRVELMGLRGGRWRRLAIRPATDWGGALAALQLTMEAQP